MNLKLRNGYAGFLLFFYLQLGFVCARCGKLQPHERAASHDRRVTPSRGLLPGTYATTAGDAKQVKTGREAVKRYALPNPKPAVHVFTIDPPIRTKLKRGSAQPAYGQPGGGVEVIFVNGSLDKTVTGPAQIPP